MNDLSVDGVSISSAATAIGSAAGIIFAMTRKSGFWGTAGFALLGAIGGAYAGYIWEQYFNK